MATLAGPRRTTARVLAGLLIALFAQVGPAADLTVLPVAAATPCVDGWQVMSQVGAIASSPGGGASIAGQPAWWVGRSLHKAPQILGWTSNAWRLVTTPWSKEGALASVSATTSTNAWAVGYLHGLGPRPISAHWDGTAWHAVTVPRPTGQGILNDVVAMPDGTAWAVGAHLTQGQLKPLTFHWEGTKWVDRSPVLVAGQESGLVAVSATPDGTVYAAGWRSNGGTPKPWIGRWNGSSWLAQTVPSVDGLGYLREIAFASATDGWTVGYVQHSDGSYGPVLMHWDGSTWSAAESPWAADSSVMLMGVAVGTDGTVTVAGNQIGNIGPQAVFATLKSGSWQATAAFGDPYPGSWVEDVEPTATGGWIAAARTTTPQQPISNAYTSCAGSTSSGTHQIRPAVRPAGVVLDTDDAEPADDVANSPLKLSSVTSVSPSTFGITAVDATAASNLNFSTRSFTGLVADFNGDTWPDVFINRHTSDVPLLELGGPSGFTQATNTTLNVGDFFFCSSADVNNDGNADLFCPTGRRRGNGIGTDEFRLGVGTTGGTIATTDYGLNEVTDRGRSSTFVHLAGDPLPDLFVGAWSIRMDGMPSFNRFYRNVDGTHFSPDPSAGLDRSLGATYATAADLDGDGNDEVLFTSLQRSNGQLRGARIYKYNGTTFEDKTAALGITAMRDRRIQVADFNNDGKLDIAQLASFHLRVSLQQPDGTFKASYDLKLSGAVAMALGDVNGDGRADVYIRGNKSQLMLVNNGDGKSFTSIDLPAIKSGSAADVVAIDYDKNGLTDFLSLNGEYSPGPLQLIAFYPATP